MDNLVPKNCPISCGLCNGIYIKLRKNLWTNKKWVYGDKSHGQIDGTKVIYVVQNYDRNVQGIYISWANSPSNLNNQANT
jgi:hypothetical protein